MMTVDNIKSPTDTDDATRKSLRVKCPDILTSVALLCSAVGLILCWFPIVGVTHALAGTVLGAMSRRKRRGRLPWVAVIVGVVATVAAVIFTISELNSLQLVNSYDASPWI